MNFLILKTISSALKNISIEINKGDKVGIVGKSGTGKTTLVSIILGLLKPSSGKIIIDDNEIDFSKYEWNKTAGYVPQEIFLLEDTVKNNITFGFEKENINLDPIKKICKDAQINDFIETLPLKYDTMIGEKRIQYVCGAKTTPRYSKSFISKSRFVNLR